jgi:hypothetical protein
MESKQAYLDAVEKILDSRVVEETPPLEISTSDAPQLPKGFSFTGKHVGSVPIVRDSRVKLKADKQLKLYSLCSCGSGKKNKWCCAGKQMVVINTGS